MADVFISYDRADRERVQPLAEALRQAGFSVWWDRHIIAGRQFDRAIEQALDEAKCVVVCWSNESIKSEWVKNEASAGAERNILVPAFLDDVRLPLEFRRRQTVSLVNWNQNPAHTGFTDLCDAIRAAMNGDQVELRSAGRDAVALRPSKALWKWTVATLFLLAALAGGYWAYRDRTGSEKSAAFDGYPVAAQIFNGNTMIARGVFTPRGYVLAMAHSIPDVTKVSVGWDEGGMLKRSPAEVVKRGLVTREVLLLRLKDAPQRSAPFTTRIAATLEPNEAVERYLGPNDRAPGKVKKIFAEIEVHGSDGPQRLDRLLLTTMIAGTGDSGAPVVDSKGQVVGLIYGASQSETVSLMIEDIKISFPEAF